MSHFKTEQKIFSLRSLYIPSYIYYPPNRVFLFVAWSPNYSPSVPSSKLARWTSLVNFCKRTVKLPSKNELSQKNYTRNFLWRTLRLSVLPEPYFQQSNQEKFEKISSSILVGHAIMKSKISLLSTLWDVTWRLKRKFCRESNFLIQFFFTKALQAKGWTINILKCEFLSLTNC